MKKLLLRILDKIFSVRQSLRYEDFRSRYDVHSSFRFNGEDILLYGQGEIKIDADSYIGSYSTLQSVEGMVIRIGKNCRISHNVRFYTQSAIPDYDFNKKDIPRKSGSITVGNAVWIGANVFINPGITIGDNAVIGANSVITKNIEANGIYGGVPAKLIRMKKIEP